MKYWIARDTVRDDDSVYLYRVNRSKIILIGWWNEKRIWNKPTRLEEMQVKRHRAKYPHDEIEEYDTLEAALESRLEFLL